MIKKHLKELNSKSDLKKNQEQTEDSKLTN